MPAPLPSALDPRVRRTAEVELAAALAGHPPPAGVRLGLAAEFPGARIRLAADGLDGDADAFLCAQADGELFLLGSTPRGVLQAVFALRDHLADGGVLRDGLRLAGRFQFNRRIFHGRFDAWPAGRADIRFLAQLGATHCLVAHDWQGSRRSLQGYVASPIFPDAVAPAEVAANHAGLRRLLDDCTDHGLGAMLWLTELPCQGGPWVPEAERARFLKRYPAEVLSESGTYEGKVLCFGHPRVREFYADLLARFFAAFPEVETIFLFGQDSGGEFCDPATCPRCRGLSRLDQRDRLIHFLVEEGGKLRPGLRVLTTGWGWDQDAAEFLRHQRALPAASGVYLAAQKDGWQGERQAHGFLAEVRQACRERGQLFIGYDNLHWGDDTVHGIGDIQDFPLGIGAKLRRWRALGADGVFDHWGNAPEDCWSNSLACREFFLRPDAEPAELSQRIAVRQFGPRAAPAACAAWEALERAHTRLSPACTWAPGQWPMWYAGRSAGAVPDPAALAELRRTQLAERREGDTVYNPRDFAAALQAVADAWRDAAPHFEAAAQALEQAAAEADDTPAGGHAWWNGSAAVPARRQHLLRQRRHALAMAHAGREIGLQFALYARWECTGGDLARYRVECGGLLRETAAACRAAARCFGELGKPAGWDQLYAAKAARLEAFLNGVSP